VYLYWDELPPFSRHSLPAFRIARQGARWKVTGVKIRPSVEAVVEVGSIEYEPGLSLDRHLPREGCVLFGVALRPRLGRLDLCVHRFDKGIAQAATEVFDYHPQKDNDSITLIEN